MKCKHCDKSSTFKSPEPLCDLHWASWWYGKTPEKLNDAERNSVGLPPVPKIPHEGTPPSIKGRGLTDQEMREALAKFPRPLGTPGMLPSTMTNPLIH
jgi:hypothetical protein